jgi:hypothetical protein
LPNCWQTFAGRSRTRHVRPVLAGRVYRFRICCSRRSTRSTVAFRLEGFTSDLHDAYTNGLIDSKPHFNSVSNYLSSPDLTDVLKELITASSLPLKAIV